MKTTYAALILVLTLILAATAFGDAKPVLNLKSMPEHGLFLFQPNAPEASQMIQNVSSGEDELGLEGLPPLSVLLLNRSGKDIVAYSIRWEFVSPEGNQQLTFAGGLDTEGTDEHSSHRGESQRHSRYKVSSASAQIVDLLTETGIPMRDVSAFKRLIEQPESRLKLDKIEDTIARSVSISIVIDSVIFADGTYAGENLSHLSTNYEEMIIAKRDLAREVITKVRGGSALCDVLRLFESRQYAQRAKQYPSLSPPQFYFRYKAIYLSELSSIEKARGSNVALRYCERDAIRELPRLARQ